MTNDQAQNSTTSECPFAVTHWDLVIHWSLGIWGIGYFCRLSQKIFVLLEPSLGVTVIGARFFDPVPITARMIHLPQMHQLVKNDVIAHKVRRLDQAPVQRNRPFHRTRSPARSLIAHRDAADGELVARG